MISKAPDYSEGVYSTHFYPKHDVEDIIFKNKSTRYFPPIEMMVDHLKEKVYANKKLSARLRKLWKKRKFTELTNQEVVIGLFDIKQEERPEMLPMNYFSQYIPEVGFRFGLDMMFNCPRDQLYIALVSINPPANYYKKDRSLDKLVVVKDLDFDSSTKTPKFKESMYVFSNVPMDFNAHVLIDIKAVKFSKSGITEVSDFAWTIFPLFSVFDFESNPNNAEIFIRSGRHMLQLFSGGMRNEIVKSLQGDFNDSWEFLLEEKKRRVSSVNFLSN